MPAVAKLEIVCCECGTHTHAGAETMAVCCARDLLRRFYAGEFNDPPPTDLHRLDDDGAPTTEREP